MVANSEVTPFWSYFRIGGYTLGMQVADAWLFSRSDVESSLFKLPEGDDCHE